MCLFFWGRGGPVGGGGGSNYFLFVCGKHCGRKRRVADKSGVINVVAEQLVVNLSFFFFSFFFHPPSIAYPQTPPSPPSFAPLFGRVLDFEGGIKPNPGIISALITVSKRMHVSMGKRLSF